VTRTANEKILFQKVRRRDNVPASMESKPQNLGLDYEDVSHIYREFHHNLYLCRMQNSFYPVKKPG